MLPTYIVGVDPGLVHTGVVGMLFLGSKRIRVGHVVIDGPDPGAVAAWVEKEKSLAKPTAGQLRTQVYIEGYRPRSHFDTDARMTKAVADIKAALPGSQVLANTGVKQVITKGLMELLHVWTFNTPTHHQDLRSAARIALLGMLKADDLNLLVSTVVRDHLAGADWSVEEH